MEHPDELTLRTNTQAMKPVYAFLIILGFLGCKTSDTWSESAVIRTPESDLTVGLPPGVAPQDDVCQSPLIDMETGSQLVLMRSANGLGDYQVQDRSYGLEQGELLRIDCRTKLIIGVVRR